MEIDISVGARQGDGLVALVDLAVASDGSLVEICGHIDVADTDREGIVIDSSIQDADAGRHPLIKIAEAAVVVYLWK